MLRTFFVFIYKLGIRLFGGKGLHKVYPFGALHDFLSKKAREYKTPSSIRVFGNTLYLFPGDNLGFSIWGEGYEPELSNFLKRNLSAGAVFLDVGANIGFFTLLAAKLVGPSGRVFASEPDPENLKLLSKNVAANAYRNVTITPQALSDQIGSVELFLSSHNAGDHAIYDRQSQIQRLSRTEELDPRGVYDQHSPVDPRSVITVETTTLDAFCGKNNVVPSIIKIDVQGAEGLVLKGARSVLERNPRIKVIMEFWPAGMKMAGVTADEILDLLSSLGFSFYRLSQNGFLPVSREWFLETYTPFNNQTGELLAMRP